MEESTSILSREKYFAKVRAALKALKGTDCILIARSNADPMIPEQMQEGCERLQEAIEMGEAEGVMVIAMMVLIVDYDHAKQMAEIVKGPKIYADVRADNGVPAVTMEQLTELGFVMCSTHFTLKAAMEICCFMEERILKISPLHIHLPMPKRQDSPISAPPRFLHHRIIWN